ncbi:MAG: EamA family transporter [Tissierellia bacterium]|nr:EamA family transporter [Tissierellia bacterium]
MFYIPILITIGANILYHISQKNMPEKVNPMFSLIITYLIALIISFVAMAFTEGLKPMKTEWSQVNWACFGLGISIVLLEFGFLLAYRVGWNISTAAIISTIVVTIALVPIGMLLYKEDISTSNMIGIFVSLIGIYLINMK